MKIKNVIINPVTPNNGLVGFASITLGDDRAEMTVSNLLKLTANIDGLFKSSKPAVKNQILRLVVSNLKIQQKRLNFHLLEPFATLVDLNSRSICV